MENRIYLKARETHLYELSTLVREFYPLITVVPEAAAGIPGIILSEDEKSAMFYSASGEKSAEATILNPYSEYVGEVSKNTGKVALYQVLSKVTGQSIPWGILTGVRPTKVAYQYLDRGKTVEETAAILETAYCLRKDKALLTAEVAAREKAILSSYRGEDVSLYAGILFCPSRCSYCSFISNDGRAYQRYGEVYVDTLVREILALGPELKERCLKSLYVGGGTPTTLSVEQLSKVLSALQQVAPFEELQEVTVEAGRPDTITRDKLQLLLDYGVNRISINPQTMNQKTLDIIGRKHTVEAVEEAFHLARRMGFTAINMDLIVGLPGEGLTEIEKTLERIEALYPDNLTVHTLAVKRSSRLNEVGDGGAILRSALEEKSEIDAMLALCAESARRMGMQPYYMYRQKNMAGNFENIGYAVPGKEGLYNIEIMEERQSILAFGAGGVSKLYDPKTNRIERVPNVKGVKEYIERIDAMIERKVTGLRTLAEAVKEEGESR